MCEILDISSNKLTDLDSLISALKPLTELRELTVTHNPCTPDDSQHRTLDSWWCVLREALVEVHYIDECPTGRFDPDSVSIFAQVKNTSTAASASNRSRPPSSQVRTPI